MARQMYVPVIGRVIVFLALAGLATAATTRSDARPAATCTAASTRALLRDFTVAFNAGDTTRLDTLFATGTPFKWFSSAAPGPHVDPEATNRSSLTPYFTWRHALHDRIRVVSSRWNGVASGGGLAYGNVSFVVERRSADLEHGRPLRSPGKAAAVCGGASPQFIVMSLGSPAILKAPLPKRWTWQQLHRPLRLPALAAGATCPTTPRAGKRFGIGPAEPGLSHSEGVTFLPLVWNRGPGEVYAGWRGGKALWRVPGYRGPVLVRGGRLDGAGSVGFDLGPAWTNTVLPEVRLVGPLPDLRPAATFVHEPGCYAYQLDTPRYSTVVVFEARVVG